MNLQDLISEIGEKTFGEAVKQLAQVPETAPDRAPASPDFIRGLDAKIASILDNSTPPVSLAAEYALWVDFFENQNTVSFAWSEIEKHIKTEAGHLKLLSISGPVPFPLKQRLYEHFLARPQFHGPLLRAFYASLYEVYGQADKAEIGRMLRQLQVSREDEVFKAVVAKLP